MQVPRIAHCKNDVNLCMFSEFANLQHSATDFRAKSTRIYVAVRLYAGR